jgi:CRP/FNR family transcriptional regulator
MSHLNSHTQIKTASDISTLDPDAFVIREREELFSMGEHLSGVYHINSGSVKLMRTTESGDLQIIGFYMAGELIGLDALADGVSRTTAVVMETSNITLISFEKIINRDESFDYHNFILQIGASFNRESDHTKMLSQCTADRRLAWFLIDYSDGLARRGFRAGEFTLPMKRADIALYLGMADETLSRVLTKLSKKCLVKKYMRNIVLLDIEQLRKIACCTDYEVEQKHSMSNHANGTKDYKQTVLVH